MKRELRERQKDTWRLYTCYGVSYRETARRIGRKYDHPPSTIESDLDRLDDWLLKLDLLHDPQAHSRLRELRQDRQILNRMAAAAERDGDRDQELKLRKEIAWEIERDVEVSQSIGLTAEASDEHRHEHGYAVEQSIQALREARDRVDMNELSEEDLGPVKAVDPIDYDADEHQEGLGL